MLKVEDKVTIKKLEVLISENHLKKAEGLKDVYTNKDMKFVIFPDFHFFGASCTISAVDTKDPSIPYFLSNGIWVPEFMLILNENKEIINENEQRVVVDKKNEPKKEEVKPEVKEELHDKPHPVNKAFEGIEPDAPERDVPNQKEHKDAINDLLYNRPQPIKLEPKINDFNKEVAKPKVYINKYNNKPFGKLFLKLIELDEKIAEFSSTSFSHLKKHELIYIATLLTKNENDKAKWVFLNQKDLAQYCFIETVNLNNEAEDPKF